MTPYFYAFNPAYAQVMTGPMGNVAGSDVVTGGMTPQQATDKALKRLEAIFANYPIQQA